MSNRLRIPGWMIAGFAVQVIGFFVCMYLFTQFNARQSSVPDGPQFALDNRKAMIPTATIDPPASRPVSDTFVPDAIVGRNAEEFDRLLPMAQKEKSSGAQSVLSEIEHNSPRLEEADSSAPALKGSHLNIITIRFGSPTNIAKTVKDVFDNSVRVSVDENSRSVIVSADEETQNKVADLISEIEDRTETFNAEVRRAERHQKDNESSTVETEGPSKLENRLLADQLELQELMKTLGQNHPKIRQLEGRIQTQREWLDERQKDQKRIPQRADLGGDETQLAAVTFPRDDRDTALDREAKQLATRIRSARPDEQANLRKELEAITQKQFEHRQQRRKQEFDSLSQRVERLKASHLRRQSHQAEVIERRISDLLDPKSDLRWEETGTTGDAVLSKAESTTTNETLAKDTKTAADGLASTLQREKSNIPDPTYNGVTLTEWLRLMETERNQEKIAEAVMALNHLMDRAEPRQLIRTTLQMMRFQGTENMDSFTNVIMNGSVVLLKLLPSDILVEELVAEVGTSSKLKPTRDFLAYFFNSLDLKFRTSDIYSSANVNRKRLLAIDHSRLSDSVHRLRLEIRHRSRRLIGSLVTAARQDDIVANWAVRCADEIVHISDQPIATYPDLVPIVEHLFERPVKMPMGSSLFDSRPVAAFLLGESGLRVPDVLAFARDRIQEEDKFLDPRFEDGMRCLVAIAPYSPEAVNLLGDALSIKWNAVTAFDDDVKAYEKQIGVPDVTKQPNENIGATLRQQCWRLIGALLAIGKPAAPTIPRLAEIANSSNIVEFAISPGQIGFEPGPDRGTVPRTRTFQDFAKAAIKRIEEAKPKPKPEPLPEDLQAAAMNPVQRKSVHSPESHFDDPRDAGKSVSGRDSVETTYDGITYSQWLKLLETERKPQKNDNGELPEESSLQKACLNRAIGEMRRIKFGKQVGLH